MTNPALKAAKSPKLLFQFNVFCILFIGVVLAVAAAAALQQINAFSARLGLPVTARTAAFINGDRFQELSRTLDGDDPFFEETRLWMYDLKQEANCIYLYTMAPVSDTVYRYIIDGSAPPGEKGYSPLGSDEDISGYDRAFLRTMETGSVQLSELDYQQGWGWLVSSYAPIFNSRNEIVGIIGCDFEVLEVFRVLWAQILRQIILPFVVIFIGIALYFPMMKGINRLTGDLKAERDEIAIMKDSLRTGVFLMNGDQIIQSRYSRALETILEKEDLQGKNFIDILGSSLNEKEHESLKKYFKIFQKNSFPQEMLDDMNPLAEFTYRYGEDEKDKKEKTLSCIFAPVEREAGEKFILGSIEDVTAKADLRRQLEEAQSRQQQEMRSLFEIIHINPVIFTDFVEDLEYEFERINETMKDPKLSAQEAMELVFQSVHAIKSNALIIGLEGFAAKVHDLESELKKLRGQENISLEELLHITVEIEKIMRENDRFRSSIDKIQSFNLEVSRTDKGVGLEQSVLVATLSKASQRVSADLEKKVRFEVLELDALALEQGPRRVIKEVLLQLVRNSVYHGIEAPGERLSAGKDEEGLISLSLTIRDGRIHIEFQDDGQGLDFDQIRQKGEELRILKEGEEDRNTLLKAIFMPGFTTAKSGGFHAGRGVGLNLVKDRIRELKGSIKLRTTPGKGTVFNISIPLKAS
ncbi:MAG: Hpt domain-containing protein [Spirochaetaceae bacterium]|nr:Hpt domain-containing protein [Spirochaetaceae bacterium]